MSQLVMDFIMSLLAEVAKSEISNPQELSQCRALDVHHRTYKNRGNEKFADLIVLCRSCHGKHHGKGGEV